MNYNKTASEMMYTAPDGVDSFLRRYEAQASLSSHKRYYRRGPIRYSDWSDDIRHAMIDVQADVEPMVEMYIPQHKLQELVERDRYFNEMVNQHDHAQRLLAERTIDDTIRRQNPAVEKAWRNYQMLLELARK